MKLESIKDYFYKYSYVLVVLCLVLISLFLRYRGYGVINQNVFLPQLYRFQNPDYLTHDWYVNAMDAQFSVRTYFKAFVVYLDIVRDLRVTVYLIYAAFAFIQSFFVYKIAKLFFKKDSIAYISVTIMLLIGYLSLSDIPVLDNYLVPSTLSIALGTAGLYFYLSKRYILAGLILGLSTLFQFLAGFHLVLIIGALIIFEIVRNKKITKDQIVSLILMGGISLFTVVPTLIFRDSNYMSSEDAFNILGHFRSPHHFIPTKFGLTAFTNFYLMSFIGLIGVYFSKLGTEKFRLYGVYLLANLLFVLGFIFVELIPVKEILLLQFFRVSVYLTILNIVFISYFIVELVSIRKVYFSGVVLLMFGLIHNPWHKSVLTISLLVFLGIIIYEYIYKNKDVSEKTKNIFLSICMLAGLPILLVSLSSLGTFFGANLNNLTLVFNLLIGIGLVSYFVFSKKVNILVIVGILIFAVIVSPRPYVLRSGTNSNEAELYKFLSDEKYEKEIFMTPPRTLYTFISLGNRSQIVSWKNSPLVISHLPEWHERLQNVQKAYGSKDQNQLIETAQKYNATYIVFDHAYNTPGQFGFTEADVIYFNNRYSIVEIE